MTMDEIVRALRELEADNQCSCICDECDEDDCLTPLFRSAADLIEQLVAENADLRKELEWKGMVIALAQKKQAEAEAERDAALADLADARSCKTCKYACDTRDCSSCKLETCKCLKCSIDKAAWEWRGLPDAPEEGEEA